MSPSPTKKSNDHPGANVGPWSLWAIGVGAFLGGDFVGWPSVLQGGFGSGVISVIIMGFYFWMIGKVAGDLSARFREPGGTYMFCRRVYGHRISPFIAIMQSMKLLVSNCTMALAISSYIQQITFRSRIIQICTWLTCYVGCTLLDVVGIKLSSRMQIIAVMLCISIIVIFFISASTLFNFKEHSLGEQGWFHGGINGFLVSLPFGMWFLDGFEELPLAINYAADISQTVPIAMSMSWCTAIIIAIGLMSFGSAATPLDVLISAPAPLIPALALVWGEGSAVLIILDICIILGLVVGFYSFVFFIGQTTQAIASDRILPHFLSKPHEKYDTAANASIFSSCIGFTATLSFGLIFGESSAQRVLIVCSLLAAIICYFFIFGCLAIILKVENSTTSDCLCMSSSSFSKDMESEIENTSISTSRIQRTNSTGSASGAGKGYCGHDPGLMAFPLGRGGAIAGQIMSVAFLACTVSLATKHRDYRIGVTLVVILCFLLFSWIQFASYLNSKQNKDATTSSSSNLSDSTSITNKESMDMTTDSTTPLYSFNMSKKKLNNMHKNVSSSASTAMSSSSSTMYNGSEIDSKREIMHDAQINNNKNNTTSSNIKNNINNNNNNNSSNTNDNDSNTTTTYSNNNRKGMESEYVQSQCTYDSTTGKIPSYFNCENETNADVQQQQPTVLLEEDVKANEGDIDSKNKNIERKGGGTDFSTSIDKV